MAEDGKKISFSFSKSLKKGNIAKRHNEPSKKIQLIDCLEDKTIKVVGEKKETEREVLKIPVQTSRNIIDRIKETRERRKHKLEKELEKDDRELTLDELAAKELLHESRTYEDDKKDKRVVTAQSENVEDKLVIEGKEEPSLTDYESMPIGEYGLAMLRGMGWEEGMPIGRNPKFAKVEEPVLRPKGMGLGANRIVNEKKTTGSNDKDGGGGEELILKKGTYGKVIGGHYKGVYCEVEGLDDEAGRIIVRTSSGINLSLNEFLMTPVTKSEYERMIKANEDVKTTKS